MRAINHQVQSAVAQEAVEWFVKNRDSALSREDQAAFAAWLKASPLHIEEYLKTAVMSQNLRESAHLLDEDVDALLAAARTEDSNRVISLWNPNQTGDAGSGFRRRIRSRLVAALATAAVLAAFGMVWMERDGQRFGLPKDFATAHGEQRSWVLPDGTGLNLNSDSVVTVRYSRRERLVQVRKGQALFQVTHEDRRWFRVVAGEAGIIAIGTQFDVFRKPGMTQVTVVEGKVAVLPGNVPLESAHDHATLPSQAVTAGAGEQVQVSEYSRSVKSSMVNVQQTVAWVQHQIKFDQQPLGEVAEEFNRYSAVPIVIQSDRLRGLPISGVFSTYDTDSFVAFIARFDGVRVERMADRILVVGNYN
ncbi:MAG: FecR domain-containing protein [Steroidobacteraceae bacterium]